MYNINIKHMLYLITSILIRLFYLYQHNPIQSKSSTTYDSLLEFQKLPKMSRIRPFSVRHLFRQ
jgi:hypothetical protein